MKSIATFLIPITIIGLAWLPGNLSNLADRGHQKESTSEGPGQSFITFESLLMEMTDRDRQARYPANEYLSLQSSSYNRKSVAPGKPGWFADSDGVSWIREEQNKKRKEYVVMEHEGPGCITRMWTPFFYYGFNNMKGPVVRIYLDGQKKPVIEENFIALLTGNAFIQAPFANFTARAGVSFLPIPFAKSCKITMDDKAFYNIINFRAYPKNQPVRSFTMEQYHQSAPLLDKTAQLLMEPSPLQGDWQKSLQERIAPFDSIFLDLPRGSQAIRSISLSLPAEADPQSLRSTVLKITFDGKQTVWCPLGDFFCSTNEINVFQTWDRSVKPDGKMTCSWVMPYASSARISLHNLQAKEVAASLEVGVDAWSWDERSMYFHANWAHVGILPGDRFYDLNFIDITGMGVLVADALTVLSPGTGWWGEGDEKIYINEADVNKRFPSHFGTGTEDYYGWAGGRVPTGKDVFSIPFGSNVRNGNQANPRGYNICTRTRILDDIPFKDRLVFDMEASPGTDIRNPWDLLAYSMVTYWYGMPDVRSNCPPRPELAAKPILTLPEMDRLHQWLTDSVIVMQYDELEKKLGDLIRNPADHQN
jgi:hypothetical protein